MALKLLGVLSQLGLMPLMLCDVAQELAKALTPQPSRQFLTLLNRIAAYTILSVAARDERPELHQETRPAFQSESVVVETIKAGPRSSELIFRLQGLCGLLQGLPMDILAGFEILAPTVSACSWRWSLQVDFAILPCRGVFDITNR